MVFWGLGILRFGVLWLCGGATKLVYGYHNYETMVETSKTDKFYYSIGEVAAMFGVNTSTIRYWEREFDVLRPRKNKKGNRLFTQRDVRYVHVIHQLLKVRGYTLAGAKHALKDRFSDYEERIILLETLERTKGFLLGLESLLAEKQREKKRY